MPLHHLTGRDRILCIGLRSGFGEYETRSAVEKLYQLSC